MRQPMPKEKVERAAQTCVTINPQAPREAVQTLAGPSRKTKEHKISGNPVDKYTLVKEVLDYLIECTLWTTNPLLYNIKVETVDQEVQTDVRYDETSNKVIIDTDIQTELTCEPRLSTGQLLVQYEEIKNFIRSKLEQCFIQAIEPRIIIDDLLDEIVTKGADIIKYPMKDQLIQTVASYKSHVRRDEDVLRRLRMSTVIDPFETSIVVAPLIDDLLSLTCDVVSRNAQRVIKNILCTSIRRAVVIGFKLEAIMKQPQRPTTEQIFLQRKKKIAALMMKKHTETAATQTELAGVPEIAKLKPKDILCSVCARESICHLCLTAQEKNLTLPKEDTKILRTQDILLAYNPCYVIATASEEEKNPHLQSSSAMKKKIEKSTVAQLPISQCTTKPRPEEIRVARDNDVVNVLMTPKKRTQARGAMISNEHLIFPNSVSGWTRVIDDTLIRSWCPKVNAVLLTADSASKVTNTFTTSSITRSSSKSTSCCEKPSQPESVLSTQATKALRILKNAFCTRDICPDASLVKLMEHHLPIKDEISKSNLSCNVENCALLNRHHGQPININSQIRARPRADKFRSVLTSPSSES
ncbi:uncharacterized protein LOC116848602 [Odontomachus brunneus]|uniref:uncharacterized protein LOC116848602 n=1 Tax=Odontomachus brunneus TaxID=486640 RepID=UPI0013F28029|nr:uncharacterized protein LOC116848602 [Odontomachus brunneus]